jgi:hypothetical protein
MEDSISSPHGHKISINISPWWNCIWKI